MSAQAGGNSGDDDDYPGKWRPMALKVKLGRGDDEPEVEESRMVYMKEEKRAPLPQLAPVEQEEELPPGDFSNSDFIFIFYSFPFACVLFFVFCFFFLFFLLSSYLQLKTIYFIRGGQSLFQNSVFWIVWSWPSSSCAETG